MNFDIRDGKTVVTSEMTVEPNAKNYVENGNLELDGDETSVKIVSAVCCRWMVEIWWRMLTTS